MSLGIKELRCTHRAEITSARLGSPAVMVTAEILLAMRSAAGPAESPRPVIVQLLLVAAELPLELVFEVFRFLCKTVSPTHFTNRPCDEFEPAIMLASVFTEAVGFVPWLWRRRHALFTSDEGYLVLRS